MRIEFYDKMNNLVYLMDYRKFKALLEGQEPNGKLYNDILYDKDKYYHFINFKIKWVNRIDFINDNGDEAPAAPFGLDNFTLSHCNIRSM